MTKWSEERKQRFRRRMKDPDIGRKISEALAGREVPLERRERIAKTLQGHTQSEETKRRRSESLHQHHTGKNWSNHLRGGVIGDLYASILCPAGFVREHRVQLGPRRGQGTSLDFAHVEAKVNIELDGHFHFDINDEERDTALRKLGWKIIRISHAMGEP